MLSEQWDIFNGDFRYEQFDIFLTGVIAAHINKFEDCEKTILKLPSNVSKTERFNIHRLTRDGFSSESYDEENDKRIMEITLSKSYVQELFKNYTFLKTEPKSEKQKLFDSLIDFINQNLNEEFIKYMDTI
jgi:hypothetical protein